MLATKIDNLERYRIFPCEELLRRLKRPVAIAQQYSHLIAVVKSGVQDVQIVVTINIGDRQTHAQTRCRQEPEQSESAVANAEQQCDLGISASTHHEIGNIVAVEFSDLDRT